MRVTSTTAPAGVVWISLVLAGLAAPASCGGGSGDENGDGSGDVAQDDPPGDTASDAEVPCIGLTGGACNVVEQCGCSGDDACQVLIDTDTCEAVEQCLPLEGGLDVGDDCETSDQCPAGASCLSRGSPTRRCNEWCRTTEDCGGPGAECSITVTWNIPPDSPTCPGETISSPYMVCTLP